VLAAVDGLLAGRGIALEQYEPPADPERAAQHDQVLRVHAAASAAILAHCYNARAHLPSKGGRFEWSLGPGVAALRDGHPAAEYALFLDMVEQELLGMVTLGVFGHDRQIASASLVHLSSGDMLWFNRERGGNLATEADVRSVLARLLRDAPF
jgi:hypothetical protein